MSSAKSPRGKTLTDGGNYQGSMSSGMDKISNRKSSHVDIVLHEEVDYQKSSGFDRYEFLHCALPELNFGEINTTVKFFTHEFSAPIFVSSMTGGFDRARKINSAMAQLCKQKSIGMGVGSQRQALDNDDYLESFKVVRKISKDIFVMGNIGAAQVADGFVLKKIRQIVDMVQADAIAVHLNPLQEFIQPEGDRDFRGVLSGISKLVGTLEIPVVVKETGAGIGPKVASRLIETGVSAIDVSGSGGTSWAAIETFRRDDRRVGEKFRNWGIPTAEALVRVNALKSRKKIKLISSGGIRDGIDVAKSMAMGADLCAAAQPFLRAFNESGIDGLMKEFDYWVEELKGIMFLTGSRNLNALKNAEMERVHT